MARSKPTRDEEDSAAVEAFLAGLAPTNRSEVEALRRIILGADPAIGEGIKWKVPSFRTTEYFATLHLRMKVGLGLILHLGAKVRDTPAVPVEDPEGLLTWLARDRALIAFSDLEEIQARRAALETLIRQWIRAV
ncbi:MAG: DUF1801 domain-containing protein [Holophagaceae bacterium]|nr:DUF1801 domain-containing protein [Holophagaceae bacterium]